MKKVFLIACLVSFVLTSCTKETESSNDAKLSFTKPTTNQVDRFRNAVDNKVIQKAFGPCDYAAYTQVWYTGTFRFKRPITECESGFWFCTTDGIWMVSCYTQSYSLIYEGPISAIEKTTTLSEEDSKVEIVYSENNTVFMKYNLDYFNPNEYSTSDLEYLSVDDALGMPNGKNLIVGQYPTFEYDGFLIAEVNLE
jgi:hypothetical protein